MNHIPADVEPRVCRFRLASFNVQNLGRGDNPDPQVYAGKLEYLARVIRTVNPDVVVINEIRSPESFDELAVEAGGFEFRHLALPPVEHRRIQVGILSSLRVIESGQWLEFPAAVSNGDPGIKSVKFRRPAPWVLLELPNAETMFLVGVHLKSQRSEIEAVPDDYPLHARYALGRALSIAGRMHEAAGIRCLMDGVMDARKARYFGVMGDFNDDLESETLALVSGSNEIEPDEFGTDDRRELYPVGWWIPGERRFSYSGRGGRRLLDHILVSHGLSLALSGAGVESQLLEASVWWENSGSPGGYPRSDHAPVWAEFEFGTAEKKQR